MREKIAGRALLLDPGFADDLPLLFDFLGVPDPDRPLPQLSAEARQRALRGVVCRLVRAPNRREPVVTVDRGPALDRRGAARPCSASCSASVEGTQTLAIVNFRPEYHAALDRPPGLPRDLAGSRSGRPTPRELLRDLAGDDPSLDGLAELIHERTAGNPFFIEEIVRELAECGHLEGERGAYRLARPVEDAGVPASVQTVLAARIDRLEPDAKRLLQAASVAGKEVGERALGAGLRVRATRSLRGGAARADRGRLPLRGGALPGTGPRLPPPADPRGRLRHPARRAAGGDPRGDGAGADRAQPRSPRRAGGADRQPHGVRRRDARGRALVGPRRLLGRQQPAPATRCASGGR